MLHGAVEHKCYFHVFSITHHSFPWGQATRLFSAGAISVHEMHIFADITDVHSVKIPYWLMALYYRAIVKTGNASALPPGVYPTVLTYVHVDANSLFVSILLEEHPSQEHINFTYWIIKRRVIAILVLQSSDYSNIRIAINLLLVTEQSEQMLPTLLEQNKKRINSMNTSNLKYTGCSYN